MAKRKKSLIKTNTARALNQNSLLAALEKSLGVVTTASKMAGMRRRLHYEWMETDEDYRNKVLDIENMAIDFAESKLHKLIDEGDTAATIFFLKTRGKSRGYVERAEYDVRVIPIISIIDGT